MKNKSLITFAVAACLISSAKVMRGAGQYPELKPSFQTSDRCVACHNGLRTATGEDVSIGLDWRASIMANSSRDPYWQASVRRESIDHPESQAGIEDECSVCHMPIVRYEAKLQGSKGEVFSRLPFDADKKGNAQAEDGVSCSVCHQIGPQKRGTPESFNGGFVVDPADSKNNRPEYGPFAIQTGHQKIMDSSTGGFRPTQATHIRDSAVCGTCHTLYTGALAGGGKEVGKFPEQMPYLEWLHSDYPRKSSCQSCHMPEMHGAIPITAVYGSPRQGARRHTFVAANFFMQRMLNLYREDLSVAALPTELSAAADKTVEFLQSQSARLTIREITSTPNGLQVNVWVENLTGHKVPTAYPSRRAWLHVVVTDSDNDKIFESGALNPDDSIQGNDNDADPSRFEPHYREINSSDQVEIYEDIMQDSAGHVTTGLLSAVGYLKDNRLLPHGFQKQTAGKDIAVIGEAADDPNFTDAGDLVRYSVASGGARGPFRVTAELWYQPIGFRWAHNLNPYSAAETRRFVSYYESMSSGTAVVLARAEAQR
ncbi:MAG: hypothetical protein ACM34E_02025 [Acidobacteriota bacterium]